MELHLCAANALSWIPGEPGESGKR